MGLFIKILVYSNKEYAIITISVNFGISYVEIGVNLNMRQIFGYETNVWVWERQICDVFYVENGSKKVNPPIFAVLNMCEPQGNQAISIRLFLMQIKQPLIACFAFFRLLLY